MAKRLGIALRRSGDVEMNGGHAGGNRAIDIALLVVDEDAGIEWQLQRLADHRIGAGIGLEDFRIGRVDDRLEQRKQRQALAE